MKSLTGWILILVFHSSLLGAGPPIDSPDEIPFRLYRGYMILVEGHIGTLESLTFLIDTGSTSTLLNSTIAKKLGLKGREAKAVAYGKRLDVERSILREFDVGATRFRSVPVLIADFSPLPVIGNHIDAIVGMNALSRVNFAIDYKSGRLLFDPEQSVGSSMQLETSGLSLVVQLQVGGKTLRLLADTGAKELILFRSRLKGGRFWRPTLKTAKIHHLSSADNLRMVQLYQVRMGDTELGNLRAFLLGGPIQGYPGLDGILGIAPLDLDRIQFDMDKQLVSWDR